MARTAISPTAYMDAWKTMDYKTIHEATLKEASRQVNEMVKWMEWQISVDPELMKVIHLEAGVFDAIRKARNYRSTIYNRNRSIASTGFDVIRANVSGDAKAVTVAVNKISDYEDDQYVAARRILKVYCFVKAKANGSLAVTEAEEIEYEYDPEDS